MNWEDCVVDVHSLKISRMTLETMFKNCGPVRSVIHWKGQGEKPHIFFEYKSPSAADAARTFGLDRSDLQVIKISNNDMLKRKFRELAHDPIHYRYHRYRPTSTAVASSVSCSTYVRCDRNDDNNASSKDRELPNKPADVVCYVRGRDLYSKRLDSAHQETRSSKPDRRDERCYSTSNSLESLPSNYREALPGRETNTCAYNSKILPTPPQSALTKATSLVKTIHESPIEYRNKPSTLLRIPHFGEVIKFDLDTQLEENPAGIIHILTAVKADQKLWMVSAAYYKGKGNLDAARKLLEAGIDMAVQSGMESDTKPFWHLLAQINTGPDNVGFSALSVTGQPQTSTSQFHPESGEKELPRCNDNSQTESEVCPKQANNTKALYPKSAWLPVPQKSSSKFEGAHSSSEVSVNTVSINNSMPVDGSIYNIPTGPRERESQPIPSSNIETQNKLNLLQTELGMLHERQNSTIADLSLARAAKRKAEDDVREERSFRRKLERDLRSFEDALKRSKRMEDAALEQVKREVEARRKVENLMTELRAKREKSESPHPMTDPSSMLLHLASLLRNVNPIDRPASAPSPNSSPVPSVSDHSHPALPRLDK